MANVWIITKRELQGFFDSLMAYILLVLFLGLSGFFTWLFGQNIFEIDQASLTVFFSVAYWTLFFFIPTLTMRMLAEENRSGTIEMLATKAINDWEIVLGKFLACWILVLIALACTLPYYATVANIGNIDHGATIGGYIGLILISAAYTSIGLFTSSLTNNQIVAILLALFVGIFFQFLFGLISDSLTGWLSDFFHYLNFNTHYNSISRGVIDSKNIIYLLTVTFAGLFTAQIVLSKRNWTQ